MWRIHDLLAIVGHGASLLPGSPRIDSPRGGGAGAAAKRQAAARGQRLRDVKERYLNVKGIKRGAASLELAASLVQVAKRHQDTSQIALGTLRVRGADAFPKPPPPDPPPIRTGR